MIFGLVCGRVQLSTGQLPEAFEGEERTVAGVGDVLQLVSGRQLLGVVRERHDARLPGPTTLRSPSCIYAQLYCCLRQHLIISCQLLVAAVWFMTRPDLVAPSRLCCHCALSHNYTAS